MILGTDSLREAFFEPAAQGCDLAFTREELQGDATVFLRLEDDVSAPPRPIPGWSGMDAEDHACPFPEEAPAGQSRGALGADLEAPA